MTSTTDHMISADPQLGSRPVEVPVLRFIMKILAGAAMLAALGLWLVPGSNWAAEVLIMKLGLTCFFAFAGAVFLMLGRR